MLPSTNLSLWLAMCEVKVGSYFLTQVFGHLLNYDLLDDREETTAWENDFLTDPEVCRAMRLPMRLMANQMIDSQPHFLQGHPPPPVVSF
jgi:hypothetical protein